MTARELLAAGLETLHQNDPQAVDKLLAFSDPAARKNKVMNLTAVTDPMEVVTRHFLDCAPLAPYAAGKDVVDVGCGAGFPGVPLAILTDARVTLLDALGKRIPVLQEVIDALPLDKRPGGARPAEEFGHREAFDLAVSRAVAKLNVLAELSMPLVKPGGYFIAMKAVARTRRSSRPKRPSRCSAAGSSGWRTMKSPWRPAAAAGWSSSKKVKETPKKYPRRFQKISSDPL